jgi:hypothetical protein
MKSYPCVPADQSARLACASGNGVSAARAALSETVKLAVGDVLIFLCGHHRCPSSVSILLNSLSKAMHSYDRQYRFIVACQRFGHCTNASCFLCRNKRVLLFLLDV